MIIPFVRALEVNQIRPIEVLVKAGLKEDCLEDGYLLARQAHQFLNLCAAAISDPQMGYHIGSLTSFPDFPNLRKLPRGKCTLGDLLSILVIDAPRLTNQATYEFSVKGERAILTQRRHFRPIKPTIQGDGLFVGFILKIIRECVGDDMAINQMTIRLGSGNAIPDDEIPRTSLIESSKGVSFTMPSDWVLKSSGGVSITDLDRSRPYFPSAKQTVRAYLRDHYSDSNLRLVSVAKSLGKSGRTLQLDLAAENTSFRAELQKVRMEAGIRLLQTNKDSISEIALKIGYSDSPSFIRAFKSWSGQSPMVYRNAI